VRGKEGRRERKAFHLDLVVVDVQGSVRLIEGIEPRHGLVGTVGGREGGREGRREGRRAGKR